MSGLRANKLPERIALALFGLIVIAALWCPHDASAMTRWSVNLQMGSDDYNYLAEYGEWVETSDFGWVWCPYVVEGWEPFAYGHWMWTYDGWAWVSHEPFGWLVYHYGNWYYDDYALGWFWVPGTIWSPARVEWYTFGDYCAWAPLPPPGFGWYDPWYHHRHHHGFNPWFVVQIGHFTDDDMRPHRVADPPPSREIYKRSVLTRRAPEVRDVARITSKEITPVKVKRERVDLGKRMTGTTTRTEATTRGTTTTRRVTTTTTTRTTPKYTRPKPTERQKMVLPAKEQTRVNEQAPKVEREVLTPKSTRQSTTRETQQPSGQKQQQDSGKKTIKRR
jgi:hypothetical protein